jgi:hypothetical protein
MATIWSRQIFYPADARACYDFEYDLDLVKVCTFQ